MERQAKDLICFEKDRFTDCFYLLDGAPNDAGNENPMPWGQPWNFGYAVILKGKSIEEMARNFLQDYVC